MGGHFVHMQEAFKSLLVVHGRRGDSGLIMLAFQFRSVCCRY